MKFNLSQLTKGAKAFVSKNSPEILIGVGIAGMISTVVMAVRATPKALRLIEEQSYDEEREVYMHLTKMEIVKITWPCYIPAAVTGCLSIVCLIGSSSVNTQRNAALATVYALSESRLKEYQEKVIETIGDKKESAIRDSIAKDKIERNPVFNNEVYVPERGSTLCYDVFTDKYFRSNINLIRKAENALNKQLLRDDYVSLNDFRYEIGLRNWPKGDDIGWRVEDGDIEIRFSAQLADDDTPCLVIDYNIAPQYDYRKH